MHRFVANLGASISSHRLERYRRISDGSDLGMVTNYFWNIALAEALHCSLGAFEVVLRNSIHDALTSQFGSPNWFDGTGLLDERQRRQLSDAKRHIDRTGRTVTPDRVVSSLTFGFWVTLLSRTYDARFWRSNRAAALKASFPNVPRRQRQRATIHARCNQILTLRNLAFHHEPIYDRPTLLDDYAAIYEPIAWIDPAMVVTTKLFDRFPVIHESGRPLIEATIKGHLGMS